LGAKNDEIRLVKAIRHLRKSPLTDQFYRQKRGTGVFQDDFGNRAPTSGRFYWFTTD
jgi:hypothetical protein